MASLFAEIPTISWLGKRFVGSKPRPETNQRPLSASNWTLGSVKTCPDWSFAPLIRYDGLRWHWLERTAGEDGACGDWRDVTPVHSGGGYHGSA